MTVSSHNPPLIYAGSPTGSTVYAPAAAPTGSTALQEGAMTLLTAANATARAVDPATGLLVSASSLAATQASGTIYTNQVWGLVYLTFVMLGCSHLSLLRHLLKKVDFCFFFLYIRGHTSYTS